MALALKSPTDVLDEVRQRFRSRRLALELTQAGLAKRAGVTLGSLKRFETTGLVAFDTLLKLALVLECLDDFDRIAVESDERLATRSLDAILAGDRRRKKGRRT